MIRKMLILWLCVCIGMRVEAQSYNTAGGVRLGTDWGLTLRQRVYENITGEVLIQSSFQRDETAITLMGITHQPLLVRNLNLFVGGGIHKGWNNSVVADVKDPVGLDLIAGLELTISRINLSWDFKPAINVSGGENTFYAQSGVSLRYILVKREKYDWEKNTSKRKRPANRKKR